MACKGDRTFDIFEHIRNFANDCNTVDHRDPIVIELAQHLGLGIPQSRYPNIDLADSIIEALFDRLDGVAIVSELYNQDHGSPRTMDTIKVDFDRFRITFYCIERGNKLADTDVTIEVEHVPVESNKN